MADNKNSNDPDQSKKKLILALALASVAAILIGVFQILPAQFGIDLTGYGEYTGLLKRYETQQYYKQLKNTSEKKETEEIQVLPGEELEYKLYMLEGDQVKYHWVTEGQEIFYDFHGERNGTHMGGFESYSSDTASESSDAFTATFEGTHGWYWRNDSETTVTVILKTEGKYSNVGIKSAAFSR